MITVLLHLLLLPSWFGDVVGAKEFDRATTSVVVFIPMYPGDCAKCRIGAGAILRAIESKAKTNGTKVMTYTLVYARREKEMVYLRNNGYTFGTTILDPDAERIRSLQDDDRGVLVVAYWPGRDKVLLRRLDDVETLGTGR